MEGKKLIKEKKTKVKKIEKNSTLAVIRISGLVNVKKEIKNTLDRMRLRRKYTCTLINSSDKNVLGMLEKVKHYVAYGTIDESTLLLLIKNRAKIDKNDKSNKKTNINPEEMTKELINGKTLKQLGLKPFFRLHPPRKGIKSKLQYPKGVLGNNKKDINKLIERMI